MFRSLNSALSRPNLTLGLELKDELSTVGDVNVARRSTVGVGRQILDHTQRLLARDHLPKHSVNTANNARVKRMDSTKGLCKVTQIPKIQNKT